MDLEAMTIEQLNTLSDDLTAQRRIIRDQQQELNVVRTRKLMEEQASHWGMSVEEYAKVKQDARGADEALTVALNRARKGKGLAPVAAQGATALPLGKKRGKRE